MTNYPYRHVTKHSPDSCGMLLRAAYESQHQQGIGIKPGWKHCARIILGSIKGTKLILHSSRLHINAHGAILYADILDHVDGSAIVGEFRISSRIRLVVWFSRIFFSVLLLAPITILLLVKFRDPQSLPVFGLSVAIMIIISIYLTLMFGLNRLLIIPIEDVRFVHDFIEKATSSSNSKEAEQIMDANLPFTPQPPSNATH